MLANMLAVKKGRVTKDMLLGVQAIFSIPDRPAERDKFRNEWVAEGLDLGLVPDEAQPVHIFMRGCDSVKTGRRGAPSANRVEEITPELVSHDNGHAVYQITRLVRDKANGVIDHPKAMTLRFDKATQNIECIPRDPESYRALAHIEDKVRDYFHQNAHMVTGAKVRSAVRETLLKWGATRVAERSAVYFVPMEGYDAIESMQKVLHALYGDDAYIHVIPWLNTEATRAIVEKHHTAEVSEEMDAMIADIHDKLHGRANASSKIRKDYVANTINKQIGLARKIKDYKAMLGSEVSTVEEKLSILQDQIENLMGAAV